MPKKKELRAVAKLNPKRDADIILFLENNNESKTSTIKNALRLYQQYKETTKQTNPFVANLNPNSYPTQIPQNDAVQNGSEEKQTKAVERNSEDQSQTSQKGKLLLGGQNSISKTEAKNLLQHGFKGV